MGNNSLLDIDTSTYKSSFIGTGRAIGVLVAVHLAAQLTAEFAFGVDTTAFGSFIAVLGVSLGIATAICLAWRR